MRAAPPSSSLLHRDRAIIAAGLACIAGVAWLYLLLGAGMDGTPAP